MEFGFNAIDVNLSNIEVHSLNCEFLLT